MSVPSDANPDPNVWPPRRWLLIVLLVAVVGAAAVQIWIGLAGGLLILGFVVARTPLGKPWYERSEITDHLPGSLPPWPLEPPASDS